MAAEKFLRDKGLSEALKYLEKNFARGTSEKSCLFMVVIENLVMLKTAYGELEADGLVAKLCTEIESKFADSTVFRISDNQIILIRKGEENTHRAKTRDALKKLIAQFGQRGKKSATHITCLLGAKMVEGPMTDAGNFISALYLKALENSNEIAEQQEKSRLQMSLANQIYDALGNDSLRLAFQPVIDAKTGKPMHHECLLRIVDETGKASSAGSFIHIAEKMGIIEAIDLHVVKMVFEKLAKNPAANLSFNLSNLTIGNPKWSKFFFDNITSDIARRLTVEITETAVMRDIGQTAYFIARLQETGCSVALDDFGSGYTSFRQIKGLSLDYVKIDGSLIEGIQNNEHNKLLVKSLIEFLKGLKLKTIAEFVDGGDTAQLLIKYGIDYMQGNYFGKPKFRLS